jgi:hypothetical protein
MKPTRRMCVAASGFAVAMLSYVPRAVSQLAVFDSPNYGQNLLTSLRALEQINNQVRQLQNQVQIIVRMDQNLRALGPTISKPSAPVPLARGRARRDDCRGRSGHSSRAWVSPAPRSRSA